MILAIKSTGFNLHTGSINASFDRSVTSEDHIKKDELGGARRKQEDEKIAYVQNHSLRKWMKNFARESQLNWVGN